MDKVKESHPYSALHMLSADSGLRRSPSTRPSRRPFPRRRTPSRCRTRRRTGGRFRHLAPSSWGRVCCRPYGSYLTSMLTKSVSRAVIVRCKSTSLKKRSVVLNVRSSDWRLPWLSQLLTCLLIVETYVNRRRRFVLDEMTWNTVRQTNCLPSVTDRQHNRWRSVRCHHLLLIAAVNAQRRSNLTLMTPQLHHRWT